MKQKLCLLLALILLLGIIAGCSQPNAESNPTENTPAAEAIPEVEPETEPLPKISDLERPRTPEDFLYQLNLYMKENAIGLTFSFGEQRVDTYTNWVQCVPSDTGEGTRMITDQVALWLQYRGDLSGELLTVRAFIDTPWKEKPHDYHRMLSIAASTLCDEAMTEELAAKLYDTKVETKSMEPRVLYTEDEICLIRSQELKEMTEEYSSYYVTSYKFCKPAEITHSFKQRDCGGYGFDPGWYDVILTEVYGVADDPSLTIAELENGINAYFAAEGLPLECAFQLKSYEGTQEEQENEPRMVSYSNVDGYRFSYDVDQWYEWTMCIRFTSWEDPNIKYPTPVGISSLYGYSSERAFAEAQIYHDFPIKMTVEATGNSKNGRIVSVEPRLRVKPDRLTLDRSRWDASWVEIGLQFITAVWDIWEQELGIDAVKNFMASMLSQEDPDEEGAMETEEYILSYTPNRFSYEFYMKYKPGTQWKLDEPAEKILDPQRLDLPFTFDKSVIQTGKYTVKTNYGTTYCVEDGLFFVVDMYSGHYRYRTDIYGLTQYYDTIPDLIKQYLVYIGSPLKHEPTLYDRENNKFYYNVLAAVDGSYLGNSIGFRGYSFIQDDYARRIGFDDEMYCVYYNETEDCPVDIDHMIALAVGLSQICDDGMTVEEAIALHTQEQEVSLVYQNWQISYIAPRNVAHIICKNTATGMTRYYVIPKNLFEVAPQCGSLERFCMNFVS